MKPQKPFDAYHHGSLREALVGLALEALETTGPDDLSLRDLARRAGVSANAPYRHFADKDALLAAAAERGHQLLAESLAQAGEKAPDQLEQMGAAYMAFALKNPALFRLMFSGRVPPAQDSPAMRLLGLAINSRSGHDPAGPEAIQSALAAWCLVHGAAVLNLEGQLSWADQTLFDLRRLHQALVTLAIARTPQNSAGEPR